MIIYHNVEISNRELDSKLLCAVLSCQFGNDSFLSFASEFNFLLDLNLLPSGFFHTKSIAPTKSQVNLFPKLKKKCFFISSIDEESGLLSPSYETFAERRFSVNTLDHVDIVFNWGEFDHDYLTKHFPDHIDKFIVTGSPRVDLWSGRFSDLYIRPQIKKYILIPSNFGVNNPSPIWKLLFKLRDMGYPHNPEYTANFLLAKSEQLLVLNKFLEMIASLSSKFSDYDIIIRPHPSEAPDAWKLFTSYFSNVFVDSSLTLSDWIHHSSLVIHHGCTSAVESLFIGKPVISYLTDINLSHQPTVPNCIGFKAYSKESLLDLASSILDETFISDESQSIPVDISNRFYQNPDLAAFAMSSIWHTVSSKLSTSKFSIHKIYLLRFSLFFYYPLLFLYRLFFRSSFSKNPTLTKFPFLTRSHVKDKVHRLCSNLDIPPVSVHYISPRCFIISPYDD